MHHLVLIMFVVASETSGQPKTEAESEVHAATHETSPPVVANEPKPHWSTDLLDPFALTRAQMVTRASFSDGASAFADAYALAIELSAHLNVADGISVSALLPFGIRRVETHAPTSAFIGNIRIGVSGGGQLTIGGSTTLLLSGGLDVSLPSAPGSSEQAVAMALMGAAVMRAYEPQLYVPQLFSARVRFQTGVFFGPLMAQAEVSLIPGVTTGFEKDPVLLLGAAGRVSVHTVELVEPYLELGASHQVAGVGHIAPPFALTPGVRLHIVQMFEPALFLSLNFSESAVLVLGLDLGGALGGEGHTRVQDEDPLPKTDWDDEFL